jgi:hypothetical protein
VVLLDHMVDLCLDFKDASKFFSRVVVLVFIPTSSVKGFFFPLHLRQHLLLVVLLMMAILTGVRWNLNVLLICISSIARDGEHFFMCFWPFEFLLLRKFCLVDLPISLLVH